MSVHLHALLTDKPLPSGLEQRMTIYHSEKVVCVSNHGMEVDNFADAVNQLLIFVLLTFQSEDMESALTRQCLD